MREQGDRPLFEYMMLLHESLWLCAGKAIAARKAREVAMRELVRNWLADCRGAAGLLPVNGLGDCRGYMAIARYDIREINACFRLFLARKERRMPAVAELENIIRRMERPRSEKRTPGFGKKVCAMWKESREKPAIEPEREREAAPPVSWKMAVARRLALPGTGEERPEAAHEGERTITAREAGK